MRHGYFARRSLTLGLSVCAATGAIAAAVYGAIGDKYNVLAREKGPLAAASKSDRQGECAIASMSPTAGKTMRVPT